jgi:pimeloyl-ACP methyl ester carboxylesterase
MHLKLLYLYGFASGPLSTKAQFFKRKFPRNVEFEIYDYIPDQKSFTNLKNSNLLYDLHAYIEKNYSKGVILFGSSFGGLISLWYASQHPDNVSKLILMAPTLRFSASVLAKLLDLSDWKEKGFVNIMHFRYNMMVPLAYTFYQDILDNPPPDFGTLDITIPTLIFHGKFDETVPILWSKEYAKANQHVFLHELDDDHQLLNNKEKMWSISKAFLGLNSS